MLPKWRDATLGLAGLDYVLGYLSWAMYASDHGWGLVPVLDAQYFSAGVVPTLIAIAAFIIGWWLRRLSQWVRKPKPATRTANKRWSVLEIIGFCSIVSGFVFLFFKRNSAVGPILIVIGMLSHIAASFLSHAQSDLWSQRFILSVAWIQLPLLGAAAVLFYIARIFPTLPQPLGGPRSECVQLDFDVAKVSAETLQLLAPEWQKTHTTNSGVARSRNLYLVLQSNEFLLLQVDRQTSSATNRPFRIKSSEVASVIPVTDQSP